MKKKCKNITAFILSLAVLAGNAVNILPDSNVLTAKAANISASVAQGKDESFFDAETGTLHLKGYVRNSSASDGIILPDGASREAVENIVAEEGTVLPENCHCLFYGFSNILSVDLKNADASDVTDMSGMFSFNTAPKYIDAKEYNNPWYDFWEANVPWLERIVKIDVAGLDTSKVTNMSGMFSDIYIEPLDLSSFDTSNVTDMSGMFYKCVLRNALDLSCFNTSNVTDMQSMFCDCLIDSVDLSSFDTGNVTNMGNMFWHSNFDTLDLSSFDTGKVTDMCGMFCECYGIESLDLSNFDTSNVTDMSDMFELCTNLTTLNINGFDTYNVTSMSSMFNSSSVKSLDLSSFDTSNVNDMMGMFANCESLGSLDLSGFTVGNDTDTRYMLYDCSALEPGICIVKGNSVTLDGSIGVNVYIQPCEKLAKVIMSGPDGNREYTDFTGVKQSSGDYKFTYPVNATQGNEQITLKAYDKDGNRLIICDKYYGLCNHSQVECTVYGYISKLKKSDNYSDEMLATLVDSLENYCKAAENYFNGTDNTISGIDNVTVGSVSEYATNLGDDVKISLVLNSTVALRFYTDSNDMLIDGKKATAKYKDGKKYYEISNISAQQLCTSHKITIDGTDHSCSALSYVHRVLNNPDSKDNKLLTDMAKAAYIYAKAAMAYVTH